MASETLIKLALKLGKQLGANTSKFMGTKSNISFMGSGPKDGMLFQKSINPESFATIGIEKVLPDIETSLAYATGGKLNDIQMNKLIDNMSIMADMVDPLAAKNVVDASSRFGGGLESLKGLGLKNLDNVRSKSGMVERQATDIASGERPINRSGELTSVADEPGQAGLSYAIKNPANIPENIDIQKQLADREIVRKEAVEKYGISPERFDEVMNSKFDEKLGDDLLRETADTSPLMSRLENTVEGIQDNTGIMASVERGDLPAKTGAAREFLVNSLKVGDEASSTTLSDVMSAQDMKYIFEGGGGAMGDPLVLVQKYFGPRIAEMIPNGGTTEEIAIFTKRVMNNVEDAKGFRPDEPEFDAMTARFIDEFTPPEGGQPFAKGGLAKILEL